MHVWVERFMQVSPREMHLVSSKLYLCVYDIGHPLPNIEQVLQACAYSNISM